MKLVEITFSKDHKIIDIRPLSDRMNALAKNTFSNTIRAVGCVNISGDDHPDHSNKKGIFDLDHIDNKRIKREIILNYLLN